MEKKPLSKLAVASFVIPTTSIVAGIIAIIIGASNINTERYIGHYLKEILIIIVVMLAIANIPAFGIGIMALIRVKRNNLRGKWMADWGIILSFIIILATLFILNVGGHGHGGLAANENSAAATLKLITSAEAVWRQQDCDGNGINDYWTYDISCFHRAYRPNNTTKLAFISIDVARADMAPASKPGGIMPFEYPQIEPWINIATTPKSGYCFQAMVTDEKGMPYNQNPVGPNKLLATNGSKYAFVAYPDAYAMSGINTFIINEEGTIYANDTGSDANKIILTWPGVNPTSVTGPGGRLWRVAD
ncbi:MAG: DUF2950 family protein [Planctomycetes bacterium]|nr:DUF2950 family protein [Planctomycetota bacterium]